MFYFPQSIILAEFRQNQNGEGQSNNDSEDLDEQYQNSSEIFELSQSYIQNYDEEDNHAQQQNYSQQNNHHQDLQGSIQEYGNLNNQVNNYQNIQHQHNDHGNNQVGNDYQQQINQNQLDVENLQGQQWDQQQEMIPIYHLGIIYLVVNRWLANLADPLLLTLFFLSGFMNSTSITGEGSNILKYTNFVIGGCCVISNMINILRLIKGKREQILLPLPQNPPQEEIQNVNSQEMLQQQLNNAYFIFMIIIWVSQIVLMIVKGQYEDNMYQRYLFLVFLYERVIIFLICYFRKNPKTVRKLLLYCVAAWPIYRKEFDEYIHYNFDFANSIQTTFAKDPVQNYLKFMIYVYEFILVLQIIAFGCSQLKSLTLFQEYSYFFGAFYYLSIIYIASLNYYVVTSNIRLSTKVNRLKNTVFLIIFFSSYIMFILLQIINSLIQERNKEYYILQFEPIFAFYCVCVSIRIVLNRLTLKTLHNEITKQEQLDLQNQQQININQMNNLYNSNNINNLNNVSLNNMNQMQNRNNQNSIQRDHANNINSIINQLDNQQSQNNNQNPLNNLSNSLNLNQMNHQNSNQISNQNANNRIEQALPHFQDLKNKIRSSLNSENSKIQSNLNLIVNYEGYTITISLSLLLFVYMFSDTLEIYEQNSCICNIYYFISIYSFMFYFLASKKISLAYDKLKNPSEPFSIYWIIPFQSYINKLGWILSWILSFILIYLCYHIDFTDNQFVKAEYIFMIFFALFTFFVFQYIHYYRRLCSPEQ